MNLKNQVEWALHCCAVMCSLPDGRFLSTKALSEFHGVPKEYLSKALQSLSRAGLVETTPGAAGGYRLARSPAAVSFLDIVEAVEGRKSTFLCANIRANNPCRPRGHCDDGPCPIARVMWQADEAWRRSLASVSLHDLSGELARTVPGDVLARSQNWLLDRAG
ncbi:RrF2 family transcriptional regulator [Pseudoroseomonas globiformis]|uniref:RrF2 family transcriptional regulator n=1 Tax=Teichococcus globiformis TaxID=2307229 RepID=A0ABV7FZ40_9PROT